MPASDEFVTTLQELDVENVFLYVGDAVRWDHLSDRIADRGTVLKTITASIHSPTSFASLATGRYPPNHGVSVFEHRIPDDVFRLFDLPTYQTRFTNSIFEYAARDHGESADPIYSVLDENPSPGENPLTDIEEPFVVMERGPGGHAPYGDFSGTTAEYLQQNNAAGSSTFQRDYRRSIELDTDLFFDRVHHLEDEGVADDTLIIYTSDHGELLGEGGELGHSSPMRPELAYVPTVFIHPDLPTGLVDGSVIHHVDLLPTIIDVLGIDSAAVEQWDGTSAAETISNDPRPCFYENGVLPDGIPFVSGSLRYEGVWDATGGYVFVRTPLHERLLVATGKAVTSAQQHYVRNNFSDTLGAYTASGPITYGTPSFERAEAERTLARAREDEIDGETVELSETAEERLRDLGYT